MRLFKVCNILKVFILVLCVRECDQSGAELKRDFH